MLVSLKNTINSCSLLGKAYEHLTTAVYKLKMAARPRL